MDVSKRITQLREARGMTTNKLANRAGISQSYLREIELSAKNPTVETLSYICDALGISLAEFFSDDSSGVQPFVISAIKLLNEDEQIKLADFINTLKKNQ